MPGQIVGNGTDDDPIRTTGDAIRTVYSNEDDWKEAGAFLATRFSGLPHPDLIDTCAHLITNTKQKERERCAKISDEKALEMKRDVEPAGQIACEEIAARIREGK